MLDGLIVIKQGQQIRLVCPNHQTAPLWRGNLLIAGGPVQFVKHCSIDYCNNLAYAATEAALNQEVQTLGEQIENQ